MNNDKAIIEIIFNSFEFKLFKLGRAKLMENYLKLQKNYSNY